MARLSTQNKKLIVTQEMLKTFPESDQYDLRTALIKWWINSRKTGGMRLSSAGFNLLKNMDYTAYQFNAKNIATSSNLIMLDQNLECPYYLDGLGALESKIYVLGSKEATFIKLHGNFNSFMDTFKYGR